MRVRDGRINNSATKELQTVFGEQRLALERGTFKMSNVMFALTVDFCVLRSLI